MRAFVSRLRALLALSPVLAVVGMGLIAFGVGLFCLPAALIVGGVELVAIAVDMGS